MSITELDWRDDGRAGVSAGASAGAGVDDGVDMVDGAGAAIVDGDGVGGVDCVEVVSLVVAGSRGTGED